MCIIVSKWDKPIYFCEIKAFCGSKYDIFNLEMNFEINSLTKRKSKAEVSETIESSPERHDKLFPLR